MTPTFQPLIVSGLAAVVGTPAEKFLAAKVTTDPSLPTIVRAR